MSADAPLAVDIVIDFKSAQQSLNAWQKQASAVQGFTREVDKAHHSITQVRNSMGRFGGEAVSKTYDVARAFSSVTQQAGNAVQSMLGIGSVAAILATGFRALKAEYDDMVQRQKAAANIQLSTADAQRQTFRSFQDDKTVSRKDLPGIVEKIAKDTGSSQAMVYQNLGIASSSKGNLRNARAVEVATAAARAFPNDLEAQNAASSGMMNILKANPNANASEALGLLSYGNIESPVNDPAKYAVNAAPVIAMSQDKMFGNTAREGTAINAFMGNRMGDPTGRRTGNAQIRMMQQLREAMPKTPGSTIDLLKELQKPENAGIKAALLGKMSLEGKAAKDIDPMSMDAKAFTTILGLLSGDSIAGLEETMGKIPELADADALLQANEAELGLQPLQMQAAKARNMAASAEQSQIKDLEGGALSISREGLEKQLAASGFGYTYRTGAAARFATGGMMGQSAEQRFSAEMKGASEEVMYSDPKKSNELANIAFQLDALVKQQERATKAQEEAANGLQKMAGGAQEKPIPPAAKKLGN